MNPWQSFEIERRWLVQEPAKIRLQNLQSSHITQTYLGYKGNHRIRERTYQNHIEYTHTAKKKIKKGVSLETEEIINKETYENLLETRDNNRVTILKTRYLFHVGDTTLEIDSFHKPKQLWIVEIEYPTEEGLHSANILPSWLHIIEEITGNKQRSNSRMALEGKNTLKTSDTTTPI